MTPLTMLVHSTIQCRKNFISILPILSKHCQNTRWSSHDNSAANNEPQHPSHTTLLYSARMYYKFEPPPPRHWMEGQPTDQWETRLETWYPFHCHIHTSPDCHSIFEYFAAPWKPHHMPQHYTSVRTGRPTLYRSGCGELTKTICINTYWWWNAVIGRLLGQAWLLTTHTFQRLYRLLSWMFSTLQFEGVILPFWPTQLTFWPTSSFARQRMITSKFNSRFIWGCDAVLLPRGASLILGLKHPVLSGMGDYISGN